MNAVVHSELSVKRWGGQVSDYYSYHDFLDNTKEIESSNLHRAFSHSLFYVKQVMIPIFGHTIINSDGRKVNLKDDLEFSHLLPDFRQKYIPSLSDYISLCSDSPDDKDLIETFYSENKQFFEEYPQIKDKMLSPLWNTGKLKSLLITHNSWFIGQILPLIYKGIKIEIKDYSISPSMFFNRCRFESWVNNGESGYPESFEKLNDKDKNTKKTKTVFVEGEEGKPTELKKEELPAVDKKNDPPLTPFKSPPPFDDSLVVYDGSLAGIDLTSRTID